MKPWLILSVVVWLSAHWAAAWAVSPVRLVASSTGHLGRNPSDQVVLQWAGGTEFVALFPDGTQQRPDPTNLHHCCYRVPDNRVLVITDVDWSYSGGRPGQTQRLRLSVNNLARPTLRTFPYQTVLTLDESGQGGSSQSLTSGFVLSSKARLGFDVIPGGGTVQAIVVRGYLALDR